MPNISGMWLFAALLGVSTLIVVEGLLGLDSKLLSLPLLQIALWANSVAMVLLSVGIAALGLMLQWPDYFPKGEDRYVLIESAIWILCVGSMASVLGVLMVLWYFDIYLFITATLLPALIFSVVAVVRRRNEKRQTER